MVTDLLSTRVLFIVSIARHVRGIPEAKPPDKFLSQFGELSSPTSDDYEYDKDYVDKTAEFIPTLRPRMFSASVERSYNPLTRKHHYHTNLADVAVHSKRGFQLQGSIGKIIPLFVIDLRPMLHQVCPHLVELFSINEPESGTAFITPEYAEVAKRIAQGWRHLTSIGYCVRAHHPGVCGAKRGLMHLEAKGNKGSDNFYTTDKDEYETMNTEDVVMKGTGRGPLCYLW